MTEVLERPKAARFAQSWTFRTPLRTIVFSTGDKPFDAETLAAAQSAGVLVEEEADGNDRPAKGGKTRRPINLEG